MGVNPPPRPRSSRRLRSTLDRVLIHDIKNMGFRLQMLLSNLDEHYGDPDFKRSVQDLLGSTVERLEAIAGRWHAHQDALLVKVALDLNEVLQAVASTATSSTGRLKSSAAAKLPVLALALGAPPSVWGDPDYLKDAFTSLLDNALEAAGPGGKVVIRTFATRTRGRGRAAVDIIDNGAGMPAEAVRERLLHPFQTTKEDGVGLGLWTAGQIVRHHKGALRILSQPGGGTIVRLTFPAAAPAEP
ncbi:MAG: ATP-binding protein [Thermoanaerobaculia bacterium]